MSSASNACANAIRRLAEGRLEDWAGLPEGCRHEDFAAVLEGGDEPGMGRLSGNQASFRVYTSALQEQPLQVWFTSEGEAFFVTIVAPKLASDVAALLERLGQAERRLDPAIGYHADAAQWVYAGRGLTLYVREHVNEVARLAAYQPGTPEQYEQNLGARDQRHYYA